MFSLLCINVVRMHNVTVMWQLGIADIDGYIDDCYVWLRYVWLRYVMIIIFI